MKPKKKDIRALTKDQLRDFFVANGDLYLPPVVDSNEIELKDKKV